MVEEEEEIHGQISIQRFNYPPLHLISNASHLSMIDISPSDDRQIIVFPPVNHEGLPISTASDLDTNNKPKVRPPSSISLRRVVPLPLPAVANRSVRCGWSRKFIDLLNCKLIKIALSIRESFGSRIRMLLTFKYPVTAGVLVVLMLLFRSRLRRRREESRDDLMRLIKEKDEKISYLLAQIAQMNEILLPKLLR